MRRYLSFLALLFMSSLVNASEKPNVILVMCDDLGWGDVSAFNSDSSIKTPYLSEMANAGLKFNRFYAAAPA